MSETSRELVDARAALKLAKEALRRSRERIVRLEAALLAISECEEDWGAIVYALDVVDRMRIKR